MKKLLFAATLGFLSSTMAIAGTIAQGELRVTIDLNDVKDDKVLVSMTVPEIKSDKVSFHIPSIIPGTYSKDDYGNFLENVQAFDKNGNPLPVKKDGNNSWDISNARSLDKITYFVNDTYDIESTHDVFSPAGTNILDKTNFMLNLHGFVGYFTEMLDRPYEITVNHPAALWGATSMTDSDASDTKDVFRASRYFEVTDQPIMYSKPDYTTFTVDGMEVLFSVYSPNSVHDAKTLSPAVEKMMRAQKAFLGEFNKTKKYTILLYLSGSGKDAHTYGALEHNTSTTVVFAESMAKELLADQLIDVVSHEFFHTVTPLTIHSKEIHNFNYTVPKMSEHLWMYEGVTEYFANLFQVNQELISEDDFYDRMDDKIYGAKRYNDKMSFTKMSANVLEQPYKAQYNNVYEKGALIAMCLDILIREKSNGERGVLDLMRKLSKEYGAEKPFDDKELIPKVVRLTYPEIGDFMKTYVEGDKPIPYQEFFSKVGLQQGKKKVSINPFLKGQMPYITIQPATKEIVVLNGMELNNFMKTLKLEGGDIIKSVNGKEYNLDNLYDLLMASQIWKEGENMTLQIKRDGKDITLTGKAKLDYIEIEGFNVSDHSKDKLREAWLKG
jgi:predicted metalloprotease with PDZ domain